MGRWISKAANVFKREAPEAVQPFEVDCECGQRHQGVRRKHHQHIVCTSCGASTFILPRDIYPPPLEPQRASTKRPKTVVTEEDPDVQLPEAEPDDPFESKSVFRPEPKSKRDKSLPAPRPTRRKKRKRQREEQEARSSGKKKAAAGPSGPELLTRIGQWTSTKTAAGWSAFRSFWTPFRTVAFALVSVAVLTVGIGVRQAMLTRAVQVAERKAESGMLAVREENWAEARRDLGEATSALDLLGRSDPEAEEVRQFYRESLALTRLSPATLFELLERAHTSWDDEEDPDKWADSFSPRFRGEWFVFSGNFRQIPSGTGSKTVWTLTLPWAPGITGPVALQIDCQGLSELPPTPQGTPAVVGAPLERVLPPNEDRGWTLIFSPRESFLWANFATYRHLGFEFDAVRTEEVLKDQLRRQAQVIGLPSAESLAANVLDDADSDPLPPGKELE